MGLFGFLRKTPNIPAPMVIELHITGSLEIKGDLQRDYGEKFKSLGVSQRDDRQIKSSEGKLADAIAAQQLTNLKLQFEGQNTIAGLGQEADQ